MSASPAPALRAVALQLAEALQRYEQDFGGLGSWMESAQYRGVTRELHDIRQMAASLPELSRHMADVLNRHADTMNAVWSAQLTRSPKHIADMKRLRERHRAAVEAMRQACIAISASTR